MGERDNNVTEDKEVESDKQDAKETDEIWGWDDLKPQTIVEF
jgi:hypothetical protein